MEPDDDTDFGKWEESDRTVEGLRAEILRLNARLDQYEAEAAE